MINRVPTATCPPVIGWRGIISFEFIIRIALGRSSSNIWEKKKKEREKEVDGKGGGKGNVNRGRQELGKGKKNDNDKKNNYNDNYTVIEKSKITFNIDDKSH